jgi:DoxX-like family
MTLAYWISTALSVVVFLLYGLACLFADGMKAEFERFGLSRLRLLTGALEVLGALGLVAGQFLHQLVILSAGGLTLLMLLGVFTRVRLRDSLLQTLPAGLLMVMNAYITWHALGVRSD